MIARISTLLLVVAGFMAPVCDAVEVVPSDLAIRLEPVDGRVYPPVITAIAVNPANDVIAAAGDDHAIRLLTGENFSQQRVIGKHRDWVRALDFSPDGRMLLSAGNDGRIQIWEEARDWKKPRDIAGGPALACVRFSASGRRVAAVGFDSQIFLMQFGQTPKLNLNCDCRDLRTAIFAQNDRVLAVGGRSGEIHMFNPDTGENLATISLHLGRLRDCVLVPGTQLIATVGEDSRCAFVDTVLMKKQGEATIAGCKLLSVASVDSDHVAVGGSDNLIRIVNVHTAEVTKRLEGHNGSIAVLKSRADRLISGSYDTSIRFWNIADNDQQETIATVRTSDASGTSTDRSER